jgi:hypothetical protein
MAKEQSRIHIHEHAALEQISSPTRRILDQDTITHSIGMTNGKAVGQD